MKQFMKTLFGTDVQLAPSPQPIYETPVVATVEVKEQGYPKIVQDIHTEFMTAGDKLLEDASKLLNELQVPNEEKVNNLLSIGFNKAKQVNESQVISRRKQQQKWIAETVQYFKDKYPNHKFITPGIALSICKKYNLVLGMVADYKGFVPQKNIEDINNFYKTHPEEKNKFYNNNSNRYSDDKGRSLVKYVIREITEEMYNIGITPKKDDGYYRSGSYIKGCIPLNICAPIKDMDMTNKEVIDNQVVQIAPPDPIVMMPVIRNIDSPIYFNNEPDGYIILTAWGNEASDPLVINEQNN